MRVQGAHQIGWRAWLSGVGEESFVPPYHRLWLVHHHLWLVHHHHHHHTTTASWIDRSFAAWCNMLFIICQENIRLGVISTAGVILDKTSPGDGGSGSA